MSINRGWLNKTQLLLTVQHDTVMQKQKRSPRIVLKWKKNQGAEMNKECAIFRLRNVKSDVRERVGERLVYISIEENTSGRAGRGPGSLDRVERNFSLYTFMLFES